MEPQFRNEIQKRCYRLLQAWLPRMYPEGVQEETFEPAFHVQKGRISVHIRLRPWTNPSGEEDVVVQSRASIVRGAYPDTLLMWRLLTENYQHLFGLYGLDPSGRVFASHAILGSNMSDLALQSSVDMVADTAEAIHDEILQRFGGKSALPSSRTP